METEADQDRDPKRMKSSHRPKPPPRRSISSTLTNSGEKQSSTVVHPELHRRRIEEAKRFTVAQARQDGCTGNYRIFDSQFGNFLVPTIPTRAELGE